MPTHNHYQNPFINFEEARLFLGKVPAPTLREWTSNRLIKSYKRGKRVYYRLNELEAFMLEGARKSITELAGGSYEK